ncbi:MAG: DUF3298 domain-containing protein [Ignavibacteria bacterium]
MKAIILFFVLLLNQCSFSADDYKIVYKKIGEENNALNYSIAVRYPQIKDMKNKDIQKNFNDYVYTLISNEVDTFKASMRQWESSMNYGSEFAISDTIFFKSDSLISIRFNGYSYYSGAAHPNTFFISLNYDLKQSKVLSLSDMFSEGYLKKISDICVDELTKRFEAGADLNWINEGAGPKEDNFKVFNLTEKRLLITFHAYQVAPYVAGPQEVEINYSKLTDIINPSGPLAKFIKQ